MGEPGETALLRFVLDNLVAILSGIVVPGVVFVVFLLCRYRVASGRYNSGLDAIAGLSGLDFGLIGLASVFRKSLSRPFQEAAELIFLVLGFSGLALFLFLLPTETALSNYNAQAISAQRGYRTSDGKPVEPGMFPYLPLASAWVAALFLISMNVLLFFIKAAK
jgi:hypothetical protein